MKKSMLRLQSLEEVYMGRVREDVDEACDIEAEPSSADVFFAEPIVEDILEEAFTGVEVRLSH